MAAKKPSRRAQVASGLLVLAGGLGVATLAAGHLFSQPGRLDPVVGVIGGMILVLVGAILVVPERNKALRAWFGALMVTSIALLFDWLAFGPGERHVAAIGSNSGLGLRTHFWEVPGRVMMASGAVLFNLMALWAWFRTRKRAR